MGKTTMLALNEAEEIMALCDYVLVLDSGKAVEFGETGELYAHPRTLSGMETLSPLGVNRIEVEVRKERTVPFDLTATGVADGRYLLCFHPHEVRPGTERDIPVRQVRRSLYDSSNDLVSVECSEQKPSVSEEAAELITLITPRGEETVRHIRPLTYFFFPVD
jgi:ABC-type sulfate/molybdate transport systems ATPase subunit